MQLTFRCMIMPAMAAVLLLAQGCFTWGPYFSPEEIVLQPLSASPAGGAGKVIVSDFLGGATATSTTRSGDIIQIREALSAWSLEGRIADELTSRGIAAEAYKNISPAMLNPGEILVRGRAVGLGEDGGWWSDQVQRVLCICTLFIYGGVLPFVHPISAGESMDIAVDMSDAQGKVLSSTRMRLLGYRRSLMVWTDAYRNGDMLAQVQSRVMEKLPALIADSVAVALRSAALSAAALPAEGAVALPGWKHPTVLELRLIHSHQELLHLSSGQYAASLPELAARSEATFPRELAAADRSGGNEGTPFRGYYYKVLSTGSGGRSYLDDDGRLTRGFAVLSWPAVFSDTDRWSFLLTENGRIHYRDWGEATGTSAAAAKDFSLEDPQWRRVE